MINKFLCRLKKFTVCLCFFCTSTYSTFAIDNSANSNQNANKKAVLGVPEKKPVTNSNQNSTTNNRQPGLFSQHSSSNTVAPNSTPQQNHSDPNVPAAASSQSEHPENTAPKINEPVKPKRKKAPVVKEEKPPEPPKANDENTAEAADNVSPEANKVPDDLPKADKSEIAFPEVKSPEVQNNTNHSTGIIAGIVAWSCILFGIAIVLFVMIRGRSNAEVPIQGIISARKKRKRKRKHLLPDKYYVDKY